MNMKKLLSFLLMIVIFSCEDNKPSDHIMCTEIFASITVTFKDANGDFIDIEQYQSINKRTNKVLRDGKGTDEIVLGQYTVANDMDKNSFSEEGDIVLVSAKHPVTEIVKTAEFKISADECHINKISGPTVIVFD